MHMRLPGFSGEASLYRDSTSFRTDRIRQNGQVVPSLMMPPIGCGCRPGVGCCCVVMDVVCCTYPDGRQFCVFPGDPPIVKM